LRKRSSDLSPAQQEGLVTTDSIWTVHVSIGSPFAKECVMGDRLSRHAAVGEFQQIGGLLQRSKPYISRVQAEIKSILDEVRSIKGQEYQQLRRGRFAALQNHVF